MSRRLFLALLGAARGASDSETIAGSSNGMRVPLATRKVIVNGAELDVAPLAELDRVARPRVPDSDYCNSDGQNSAWFDAMTGASVIVGN